MPASAGLVYRRPLIPRRAAGATPRREGTSDEEHASIHKEVADFVKAAGMRLNGTSSIFKRAKPLIAVPLPGVGEVDPDDVVPEQGQFVKDLLPLLYGAANRFGLLPHTSCLVPHTPYIYICISGLIHSAS